MRPSFALLAALLPSLALAVGCKNEEEKAADLESAYLDAICRLYSEPACVDNMSDTCGFSISFDTAADCKMFMVMFMDPECDMGGVLLENQDAAEACIEQIDSFDCAAEDVCAEDGTYTPEAGDCLEVSAAIAQACPSDTGTTGSTTTW
ncbi:hypothetical protein L6R53_22145 [Myxococcota bacterium]|nr:hypothetical protein [Myxococcota bacterium]